MSTGPQQHLANNCGCKIQSRKLNYIQYIKIAVANDYVLF